MPPSTTEPGAAKSTCVSAYIGLGANLGEPESTLREALLAMAALPDSVLAATSSFYRTAPIDSSGPDYLNAVARLDTRLAPLVLLAELQRIEQAQGRERPYRNAPRTLDLDLLLYGDECISTPALTVPHPRLQDRAFVVRPLEEIAPQLSIPGHGRVADLLAPFAGQRIDRLAP